MGQQPSDSYGSGRDMRRAQILESLNDSDFVGGAGSLPLVGRCVCGFQLLIFYLSVEYPLATPQVD